MANIKFSQFTQKTTLGTVDFLVGYTGAQNIQIDPVDLLSGYSQGTGAAGQVTFFSAASTVTGDNDFYWDNTNKRLGVGTTSPDRKFEVASTGTGEMCITGATGSRLYFRPTTSYSPGGNFGILVTGSGGPSYLSTMTITGYNNGLNTVMTLKGDGNVGIGTATPVAKLQVEGSFISSGISQLGTTGANVLLTSSSAGNVGIGTSSPGQKLEVNGSVQADSYKISNTTVLSGSADVYVGSGGGTGRVFLNNTSGIGLALSGSNIGIGTTTPDTKLEVVNDVNNSSNTALDVSAGIIIHNGDSSGTAVLKLRGSAGDSGAVVFGAGAGAASDKFHVISRHNQTKRFTVQANGNVGIGTDSPGVQLDVFGSDGIRTTTNSGALTDGYFAQMKSDFGANALRLISRKGDVFRASNYGQDVSILTGDPTSEKIRVTSAGNVGIGTTSPSAKLTVASGDVEVTLNTKGIILKSPDGTRYRITVANGGSLTSTALP